MGTIHELSDLLKSKIAAGEVIERPAFIVKELLDNAIDAQAKNVKIELEKGGIGKIIITDDGIGMDREDIVLCFKRHTTSKIQSEDDLDNIRSMGFRGEALASIAAVSRVTIKSRQNSQVAGYEVLLEKGEPVSAKVKGMPIGTQIKIEEIFSSVPGRQKFLKSKEYEYRKALEVITRFIIAFPEIRFDVYHEGKEIFLLPQTEISERVRTIFSDSIFSQLVPLHFEKEYFKLSGFISKPQLSYKSSRNSHLFLNKRFITEIDIINAVKESYGTLLEPTSYPHLVLFLEMPFHFIDVNVHPRKEKVHFVNQAEVIASLQEAITKTLSQANLRFYDKRWKGDTSEYDAWQIREGGTNTYAAKKLKKEVLSKKALFNFSSNQTFFQLHNLYIAVSSEKGMLVFDQHAVHERILYEQLQKEFQKQIHSGEVFQPKSSVVIRITPQEKLLLLEHEELLAQVGFIFNFSEENEAEFGAVPHILQDKNLEVMLREILDELFEKEERITFEYISHKMIAYLACRGAVKAGDVLTQKQCKELIEQLKETENPYTCPHGRPTQVEIDLFYFHKLFKRM